MQYEVKHLSTFFCTPSKNPKCNLTPFHFAAAYGHLDLCKYVSKDLEDMSPKCNLGQTPLHLAASNGHLDVCKHIMEKSANKSPKNNDGETPLHLAAYQVQYAEQKSNEHQKNMRNTITALK